MSCVILIFNPYLYLWSTHIYTEILYLIFFFASIYYITSKSDTITKKEAVLSGFFSSLAFITRFPFIFAFIGIFIYLYKNQKPINAYYYSLSFFLFISPLLIRNLFGYYSWFNDTISIQNNSSDGDDTIFDFSIVWDSLRFSYYTLIDLTSINFLFILLPFAILGIIFRFKSSLNLFIYILATSFCGHLLICSLFGGFFNYRYVAVLYPIFLLFSVVGLSEVSHKFNLIKIKFSSYSLSILSVIVLFVIFSSVLTISNDIRHRSSLSQQSSDDYLWLINESSDKDVALSLSPHRTYYFTEISSVYLIPEINSNETLDSLISQYNASFIVIEYQYISDNEAISPFLKEVFNAEIDTFSTTNYVISRSSAGKNFDSEIWFYKINKLD